MVSSVRTTRSRDYDRIVSFFEAHGQFTVGVHGTEGAAKHSDGVTIAEVAEASEFGIDQPQRSWLRAWFDENKSQIEAVLAAQIEKAFIEKRDLSWALERVALWAQADIQRRIRNGISPPNSQETIDKKGSSTPLIDTGLFRSAIVAYFEGKVLP